MKYYYTCASKEKRCRIEDLPEAFFEGKMKIELAVKASAVERSEDGRIDTLSPLVWIVEHPMAEQPELKCLVCEGAARKVMQRTGATYIRGNGYLDTKGCRRDMNLYKLQKDDPYGHMRQPGEKDDLVNKIKKAGKKNSARPQHFYRGMKGS
tara:strand:- start:72845 stop:73300 length:456 start_codon:yes stop_codon:yes gene_type:complete